MWDFIWQADLALLRSVNQFVGSHPLFDRSVAAMNQFIVKLVPMMAMLWLVWFSDGGTLKGRRAVLGALGSAAAALVIARIVQEAAPERLRPIHQTAVTFVPPPGITPDLLSGWSSFPSDHAALAFALATAIMLYRRREGLFLLFWAFVVVSLPRVYLGFHYPSDILGGALIGIAAGLLVPSVHRVWAPLMQMTLLFERRYTGLFYGAAFVATYEIATMFNDVRRFVALMGKVL